MFESPLDWCALCKEWVALDQSFAECAQRHGCRAGMCPLVAQLKPDNRDAGSGICPAPG